MNKQQIRMVIGCTMYKVISSNMEKIGKGDEKLEYEKLKG